MTRQFRIEQVRKAHKMALEEYLKDKYDHDNVTLFFAHLYGTTLALLRSTGEHMRLNTLAHGILAWHLDPTMGGDTAASLLKEMGNMLDDLT